jgi:hypothetical protein
VGSAVAQSGSIAVETAPIMVGSVLPIAKAQARPPMAAIRSGRASMRDGDINDVATMSFLRCLSCQCEAMKQSIFSG